MTTLASARFVADLGEGKRERKQTLIASYVLAALRGTVAWHTEQHRPYSATTDQDAIAVILHQQDVIAVLKASVVEMEAYNDVPGAQDDAVWRAIRERGAAALTIAEGL